MKIATCFIAAVLLGGCSAQAAKPGPTVTVTTTTTSGAVTPPICLKALDDAEEVVGYAHDVIESAARAVQAAAGLDAAGIDVETAKVQKITPKMKRVTSDYNDAALACRALATS